MESCRILRKEKDRLKILLSLSRKNRRSFEYSRNPSLGRLHREERDHADADVVVVEGLLHPLPLLHRRRRLAHLAGHEELAPEMRCHKLRTVVFENATERKFLLQIVFACPAVYKLYGISPAALKTFKKTDNKPFRRPDARGVV